MNQGTKGFIVGLIAGIVICHLMYQSGAGKKMNGGQRQGG